MGVGVPGVPGCFCGCKSCSCPGGRVARPPQLISVPWTCPCRATGCVPVVGAIVPGPGVPGSPG